MNQPDPFLKFKEIQKQGWSFFAPFEVFTTIPASKLVRFSQLKAGDKVLDAACGTGVVAITAAQIGAWVQGLDFSAALLEKAKTNAQLARVKIDFKEGDVEELPYPDHYFDVVLSQFGHMFAPRPDRAVRELLRVLKPGGRIAFSTWPPELFTGKMFSIVARYAEIPKDIVPPPLWGDPQIVKERLSDFVTDIEFDRATMVVPALSPGQYRAGMEKTAGPVIKLVEMLGENSPKLAEFRTELENLIRVYWQNNSVRQDFLMTRALKR